MKRLLRVGVEAGRVLLGRKTAGRNLTVFRDDVFLVSYPRSGNTWTRFLVGNLVHPAHPVTFANVESVIPSIYISPDRVLRSIPRPRILKSHECFDPRYKKIIYLVRDPRDVAVSYYHYSIKRGEIPDGYPIEQYIPRMMDAEFDVKWSWSACWRDHVMSWVAMRQGQPGFLLLRYEDMLQDPAAHLAKIADFLGLVPTPEGLARAVKLSSADRMRDLEKRQSHQWQLTKTTRQDKPFVRTANSGEWRANLPQPLAAQIVAAWGTTMRQLGYKLETEREQLG